MCRFQCKNVSCSSINRYQCKSETSENGNDNNGQPSKPPNFERNPNVNFFSLDSSDDSDTEECYYNNNQANDIEPQTPILYSASTVVSKCENAKASSADNEEQNTGKMQNDSDSGFSSDDSSSSSSGSLESSTTVSSIPTVPLKSILRTPSKSAVTVLRNDVDDNEVPKRVSFADRWGKQLAQYREIPARDTTVDAMLMTELVELDEAVYWGYNGADRRLNRGQQLKFRISLEEVSEGDSIITVSEEEGPTKDF